MNKRQEIALERLFAVDDTHEVFVSLSLHIYPSCMNLRRRSLQVDWKRCHGEFGEADADNVTKIVQSHAGSARLCVVSHHIAGLQNAMNKSKRYCQWTESVGSGVLEPGSQVPVQ